MATNSLAKWPSLTFFHARSTLAKIKCTQLKKGKIREIPRKEISEKIAAHKKIILVQILNTEYFRNS